MLNYKSFAAALGALVLVFGSQVARADGHGGHAKATADIVDTAVAAGSFNTLVAAVQAADLVAVLKGDGPFTVFAPTDAAFAKLPEMRKQLKALHRKLDELTCLTTSTVERDAA